MTVGKAAALTAAFLGVFAIGVAVGPSVHDRFFDGNTRAMTEPAATVATTAPAATATPAMPAKPRPRATTTRKAPTSNIAASSTERPSNEAVSTVSPSEPRLHDRLKPVLNRGARMEVAAEGFRSAEEFATVAHAARNTNVPFMVLKHRVVMEHKTLADALEEVNPRVDAQAEVARAEAAAKSDIAAIVG
jgi:hypothetical protein